MPMVSAQSAGPSRTVAGAPTFEAFYDVEYNALRRLGYVLTGSPGAAEDLVQETMLRAYRHWHKLEAYDRPGAWARRVLVNLATSRRRRLTTEARAMVRLRGSRPPEVQQRDTSAALWAELRKLPSRQAQCLALHYVEDRTVAEIAAVLECPEGTVKALLHRGRTALARALGDDDGTADDERGSDR
jgi:RNA polymerase sigma-70 factor, ECF subfamily